MTDYQRYLRAVKRYKRSRPITRNEYGFRFVPSDCCLNLYYPTKRQAEIARAKDAKICAWFLIQDGED